MVDFPDPDAPTRAVVVPGRMVRDTDERTWDMGRDG